MHGINADGLFVEAPVCENFGPPAHSNTLHSKPFFCRASTKNSPPKLNKVEWSKCDEPLKYQ